MFKKNFENEPLDWSCDCRCLWGDQNGTHDSGWTISGEVKDDYYTWIEDFKAFHPQYGEVYGNFEFEIVATSEEAYNHFVKNHPYHEWDTGDI